MTVYTAKPLDPDMEGELRGALVRRQVTDVPEGYEPFELVLVDGQEADPETVAEVDDPEEAEKRRPFD